MAKTLQQQLKDLLNNPKKALQLKIENGDTLEKVMKSQVQILLDILEEEIEKIYSRPEGLYKRSNDFRNSLDKTITIA